MDAHKKQTGFVPPNERLAEIASFWLMPLSIPVSKVTSRSYDDGGFYWQQHGPSGFATLSLADIAAGEVDCAIDKVDRLSRSLLDFTKDRRNVRSARVVRQC
ncbi:MAG: hypothetical protein R3C05_23740 [Pirellulaceae bacterium]